MNKKKVFFSLAMCMALIMCMFSHVGTVQAKTKAKLNKKSVTLDVDDSITLKVSGTKKKVSWSSSNKKIATVKSKGKYKAVVKAKKSGSCVIKAKVGKKVLKCKIVIREEDIDDEDDDDDEEEVTTEEQLSPEEKYAKNYDEVTASIKELGALWKDGVTFSKSYSLTSVGITDINCSYLKLFTSNGKDDYSITLTRGSYMATVRASFVAPYVYMVAQVDIRTIKGDGTDVFDWKWDTESGGTPYENQTPSCNAGIVNMLKLNNGSYSMKYKKLKDLGFESYVY